VPRKKTAHAELDEHRQRVAAEGMKFREAQSRLEATKAKLEDCSRALTDAYAAEDQKLARERREELKRAEAEVVDCQHRVGGAELRARRAREELDAFLAASAGVLLAEREDTAKRVAAELTRAVAEVVRARRAYDAERSHVDDLVSKLPGASPRHDGVAAGYPWEGPLRELERAYRRDSEAPPPRPRWLGRLHRETEDEAHRRLRERRRKKTAEAA
jgi:DNA repair exonuclease SbcCD ATPase subunit